MKSKFGEGAEVEVQVGNGETEVIISTVTELIPGLVLKELVLAKFQEKLNFHEFLCIIQSDAEIRDPFLC